MRRPEQLIQQGVFNYLIPLMHVQKKKKFVAFQIRNETGTGGRRGMILGSIAKSMGTMAGVADTVFLFPGKEYKEMDFTKPAEGPGGIFYPAIWRREAPQCVFVEFKAYGGGNPERLLSDDQKGFRDAVTGLGFEYKLIAASDVRDAVNQITDFLMEKGVYEKD